MQIRDMPAGSSAISLTSSSLSTSYGIYPVIPAKPFLPLIIIPDHGSGARQDILHTDSSVRDSRVYPPFYMLRTPVLAVICHMYRQSGYLFPNHMQ